VLAKALHDNAFCRHGPWTSVVTPVKMAWGRVHGALRMHDLKVQRLKITDQMA